MGKRHSQESTHIHTSWHTNLFSLIGNQRITNKIHNEKLLYLPGWEKIKKSDNTVYCRRCRTAGLLICYRWGHKLIQLWETIGSYFVILNKFSQTNNPIIPLLEIYQEKNL